MRTYIIIEPCQMNTKFCSVLFFHWEMTAYIEACKAPRRIEDEQFERAIFRHMILEVYMGRT